MLSIEQFTVSGATKRLLMGETAAEVFGPVFKGPVPKISADKIFESYIESPENEDPEKTVVATVICAAGLDIAAALQSHELRIPKLPKFTLADKVTNDLCTRVLGPEFGRVAIAISDLATKFEVGKIDTPHFNTVFASLREVIVGGEDEVQTFVGTKINRNSFTLVEDGLGYPELMAGVYAITHGENPIVQKLLRLAQLSTGIFTFMASRDVDFLNIASNQFSLEQSVDISVGYLPKRTYFPEKFKLDSSGPEEKVVVGPDIKAAIYKKWSAIDSEETQLVTGCPVRSGISLFSDPANSKQPEHVPNIFEAVVRRYVSHIEELAA